MKILMVIAGWTFIIVMILHFKLPLKLVFFSDLEGIAYFICIILSSIALLIGGNE